MLGTLTDDELLGALELIGSPAFAVDVRADGTFRFVGVNEPMARQMGVARDAVRGVAPDAVLCREDAEVVTENYRRCVAAGTAIECEELLHLPVGERWWRSALKPQLCPEGSIIRVIGTCFDITERKHAEAELQRSQAFLAGLIENIPAAVFCKEGPEFRYMLVNRAAERMFGIARDRALGRNDHDLYPASIADRLRDEDRAIAADPARITAKRETIPTPGGDRVIRTGKTAIADADGHPRYILGVSEDVTETERMAGELREAKDFLQTVLDHIPALIFCKDAATLRYTLMNRAGERYVGRSRDDVIGRSDDELFAPPYAEAYRREDLEAVVSGTVVAVPSVPMPTPFGERTLRTTKMVIPGEDGSPRYLLGVSEDITDRRVAEDRLHAAIEALRDGFILFDRDDRIVMVNSRFLEIYGYMKNRPALEGSRFQDNIAASREWRLGFMTEAEADAFVTQRIASWRRFAGPFEQQLPGGRWVLVNELATADGGVVAIHTDITAQKQAETRLVDAIESIDQGFILCDEDDRVVLTNRRLREMFPSVAHLMTPGTPVLDIIRAGAASGDYRLGDTRVEEAVETAYRLFRDGTAEGIERQLRDGRWILFNQHVTPNGLRVGLRTDITLLKARQQQLSEVRDHLQRQAATLIAMTDDLRQARFRAEEANRAKSQFLAMISHELRTPFTGIRGMADLLAGTRLDQDQQRYLQVMRQSFDRLLALLDQLLDFSRIEAGRIEVASAPLSPARVLADAAATFEAAADAKGLSLDVEIAPNVPREVLGDPHRISQILANLVGNAVKFTEAGRITVSVGVEAGAAGPLLRWSVADSGIGITETEQARLFEPFSQADADTSRRFGGTGLGLAISRRLAEAMGGRIGVDSRPGEGARFWFTTAYAEPGPHVDVRLAVDADERAASPADAAASRRVLIAEDDQINQLLIATMLKRWGFETVVVDDGAAALEALDRGRFDVVVMDVNMPVLDGPSAVRRLRAEGGPLATLPVFALTADVVAEHMERFREAGFTEVMSKPIDWNRLRGALETAVTRGG